MSLIPSRLLVAGLLLLLGSERVFAAVLGSTPEIQIIEPQRGTRIAPGSPIRLTASVSETNALERVEFFADERFIGSASNAPFSIVWTNVPEGVYDFSAQLNRENAPVVRSDIVTIRVTRGMASPQWIQKLSVEYPFLRYRLWGNELWKYIFSLVYIFLAFYVSKFLDFLTRVWLKRWAARTTTQFDDLLLELLNGPIKVVAFIIFLRVGLDVFDWPALVQRVLAKAFTIVVALSLTYMVLKFIDLLMGYWRGRVRHDTDRHFDEQLFPIIRKSLKVFIIVVAALVTLDNVGIDVTAAIASLSIGGLAVGLAAQDTIANLFGAVSVFVDKPFRVGDFIDLGGTKGSVESIGLRSTRLRHPDGHLITVPNKTMGNSTITNVTRRPNIKTELNIGITYDTSPEKVRLALKILEDVYRGNAATHDLMLSFNRFADSALNISVVHWWKGTDFRAYLAGMQEMNLAIKQRFDAEGISFAFPSQTVYLKQDSEWKLQERSQDQAKTEPGTGKD
ncbi:MAG TPA: mechanosensitive ion channel domain-containing protein [Verrucomicrobiae bacterium]|nr:mechanosensitive ion channel domain-containing protein [Verrucomicrobiae bacterium]